MDIMVPDEFIGSKVEINYDFFPGCMVGYPYPNTEYLTLDSRLAEIPTKEMVNRLVEAIGEIQQPRFRFPVWYRRWMRYRQNKLSP